MSRLRTTRLLPAVVASLALALTGCGSDEPAPAGGGGEPPSSTDPADETLALTVDGSAVGKCAMPNAATLSGFDTAFAGTVTSLAGGTATLSVEEWYAGGGGTSSVTVDAPEGSLADLLTAVDFRKGRTYLVSADGERVTLCGFTAERSPELQAIYDEAFAG